ncbi:MAG: hypothetical protein H8E44_30760 [Planctomycetes bacterium]|nr:hypothetical protein [Planctomycetota bacterium]MBL7039990.1 hypothetical protein [Pirellulaceae bacterium]
MKTRRLRLVRPRWTLGTMLLVVGWSAVVVWLNVRPRVVSELTLFLAHQEAPLCVVGYGRPWRYASTFCDGEVRQLPPFRREYVRHYRPLAANIAIGLVAVAVLTFASKYLVRAIVAGVRAIQGKPPPGQKKGPERAS